MLLSSKLSQLDEDKSSDGVDPKFSADIAESYFKEVYRSEDREYHQPDQKTNVYSSLCVQMECYI